ncbi:MAG: hypothetical protein LBS76_01745 [Mycoplasmataceae bacterium]|jgi:hypothetical protein|nr:hypothetical protein [Mycoplasmataceae bacterium]
MSYNKKEKMIKIEQYEKDPNREGHEIKVSILTKKRPKPPKPPIPSNPKPHKKSLEEKIAEVIVKIVPHIVTEALKPIGSRLDTIDTRLVNLENRMTNVETIQKEQSNLFQTVIKLNNLKTA